MKTCVLLTAVWLGLLALAGGAAAPSTNRSVVCVSTFDTGDNDETLQSMATGVPDLLMAALSTHGEVNVVDRSHLADVMREQALAVNGLNDPATAMRVGRLLGADRFITGSVLLTGGELTIIAHVLDVKSGTIQASRKATGKPDDLMSLAVDLAGQLASALNIKSAPASGEKLEDQPIGSLHFLRGLGYFHAGNFDRAVTEFLLCGDVEPDHRTFRYWVGLCYYRMNEWHHARIELARFVKDAPASDKAADARRLLAECEVKLKDAPPYLILSTGSTAQILAPAATNVSAATTAR